MHPLGQQVTDGSQGTRAGQHHPDAPQGQHRGLGLAQMGQMMHDGYLPLVETAWQNMASLLDEDLEAALKGFHLG